MVLTVVCTECMYYNERVPVPVGALTNSSSPPTQRPRTIGGDGRGWGWEGLAKNCSVHTTSTMHYIGTALVLVRLS
jgi:hypothetical protein